MPTTLGALLRPRAATDVVALARHAETLGLGLVVVDGAADLDPWVVATWVVGVTEHIAVGVSQAPDGDRGPAFDPLPQVLEKAAAALDRLGPGRLLADAGAWTVVDLEDLTDPAPDGMLTPVQVVPVSSIAELDALAARLPAAAGSDAPGRLRSIAALARRRPGIDYDGVPASLVRSAVEPGDANHDRVSATYMRGGAPGLVLRPTDVAGVADAVAFAARHRDLPLGLRSGGHGISGRSTNRGGLVIDVGGLDEIEVLDQDERLVRVGPGASWKRVAAALDPLGWAISSGDYGGVGVGGLATIGGVGLLGREQGLTIDRVRAMELVLADGAPVRASATEEPDLFWAMRGAGASFGVVTAVELQAAPVTEVGFAQLAVVVPDLREALVRYGALMTAAPRDTTLFVLTGARQQGLSVLQLYGVVDSPDPDVVIERLTPFAELGQLAQQRVVMTRYAGVLASAGEAADGHHGVGEPRSRSVLVREMTDDVATAIVALADSGASHFLSLRAMGGAINDVPADATAFGWRDAAFSVVALGADDDALTRAFDPLRALGEGMYPAFETGLGDDVVARAFPPATLERLRAVKRRYDPTVLFRDNMPITPADATTPQNDHEPEEALR